MSEKTKKAEPTPLAQAALAVDAELERFEALSQAALKMPLDSQKRLARAAEGIQAAAQAQARLGELMQAFMLALTNARERNGKTATALAARTEELRSRADQLAALRSRFGALAERAREISLAVKEVPRRQPGPALAACEAQLALLGGEVDALRAAAQVAHFSDVRTEAESLGHRLSASQKKIAAVRATLDPGA